MRDNDLKKFSEEVIEGFNFPILPEMKSALEEILETNSVDWLSDFQKNLIVVEAEELGINNTEDLAGHLFLNSKVFKNSLK